MSESADPATPPGSGDAVPDPAGPLGPVGPIRALAAENTAAVLQLRGTQIPQHVGMAMACRALAVDLPREGQAGALEAQTERLLPMVGAANTPAESVAAES